MKNCWEDSDSEEAPPDEERITSPPAARREAVPVSGPTFDVPCTAEARLFLGAFHASAGDLRAALAAGVAVTEKLKFNTAEELETISCSAGGQPLNQVVTAELGGTCPHWSGGPGPRGRPSRAA